MRWSARNVRTKKKEEEKNGALILNGRAYPELINQIEWSSSIYLFIFGL